MSWQISNHSSLRLLTPSTPSATGLVSSPSVDVSTAEGIAFFFSIASFDAANAVRIEQSIDNAAFVSVASVNTDSDGQVLWVDVYKPRDSLGRHVRVTLDRQIATAVGEIYAMLYQGRHRPMRQPPQTSLYQFVSPAQAAEDGV